DPRARTDAAGSTHDLARGGRRLRRRRGVARRRGKRPGDRGQSTARGGADQAPPAAGSRRAELDAAGRPGGGRPGHAPDRRVPLV
ncbi:MAG: hypothetical protein AVDCRST_MAG45-2194, partial [uncultured Solirubrobacterales bacterium]